MTTAVATVQPGDARPMPDRIREGLILDDSPRIGIRLGIAVTLLFLILFGLWAPLVRLDAAAQGEGQVSISGNRQTVQHRDGGIVQQLAVREGQHVAAGQILIRLHGAEVVSTERALSGSVIDLLAQRARLEAEIRGTPIRWPDSFATATGDDRAMVERAQQLQDAQLRARSASLAAGRAVLNQQEAELSRQTTGFTAQSRASADQRTSLQHQLESTRRLADQGYVSRNSVRALERSIQQMSGNDVDYASRAAAAREQIGETRKQVVAAARRHVEDSATLLRDTQFQLNETLPKLIAAKQALARTVIRAPVAGQVVGLRVFSMGGVIQAGQPILDIVPDAAPLVIRARFDPSDIDGVFRGKEAEVKFLSLHERGLPVLLGRILNVSADSLSDEKSGMSYFTAEVVVPRDQIARLRAVRGADLGIRPGVPVAVMVKLRPRTALQYMIDPFTETFRRSLHER